MPVDAEDRRRRFEQECRRELERDLRPSANDLIEVLDVRLDGSFPDTDMVIRYVDRRDGEENVYRHPIWESDELNIDDPLAAAIEISILFMENY